MGQGIFQISGGGCCVSISFLHPLQNFRGPFVVGRSRPELSWAFCFRMFSSTAFVGPFVLGRSRPRIALKNFLGAFRCRTFSAPDCPGLLPIFWGPDHNRRTAQYRNPSTQRGTYLIVLLSKRSTTIARQF